MSFFIGKNEIEADELMSPKALTKLHGDIYNDRFDAVSDIRKTDDGSLHRGNGFRRVASFVNIPLWGAITLLDPEFMKDKKKFYAFLRRNREYATYDITSHTKRPRYTSTVVDGHQV
jgi:hypothetical protein